MSEFISKPPLLNSYWVVPGQLLAGEHPGDMDETAAIKRLGALVDAGVRTFIDLTEEDEINEDAKLVPGYHRFLRSLIAERRSEITYVRMPVPDRGIPSVWTMRRILDLIDRSLADENPTYVHCWAGRGRTGTVVGCYLKRHAIATEENVIEQIHELRREMPTGRETSPHTPEQIRMVRHWKPAA
jgi:hypothetical protein